MTMSTSTTAQTAQPTPTRLSSFIATARHIFIDPLAPGLNATDRRTAQLAAGLLLLGFVGVLIRLVFFTFDTAILVSSLVTAVAYGVARTRFYRISVIGLLLALAAPSFANTVAQHSIERDIFTTRMIWLVLPIILAGVFLTVWQTALIVGLLFGATLALIPLMPGMTVAAEAGILGLIGLSGLITIAGMVYRDSIERERQKELVKTNADLQEAQSLLMATVDVLQESETILEKRVEERTRELVEARAAAEKANEIKSQFLANMSHELRTPLNAILNFTAFVADGVLGPVNDQQTETLYKVNAAGKHLLSLINDVLDITKIESGMMDIFVQQVDLNAILSSVMSVGTALVKDKPVKLVAEIDEKLPSTYGDQRRLRQVFLNLLSNATKFTRSGAVTVHATHRDGTIHVMVRDTGVGIAPEDYERVFDSFKQSDKHNDLNATGTGLGMPITKYFVEIHGGKIWFESKLGEGTTFFVDLPVQTQEVAEARNVSTTPARLVEPASQPTAPAAAEPELKVDTSPAPTAATGSPREESPAKAGTGTTV
jgi:signal transduction histidine kinase